jgi:hypothetical protein
MSATVWNSKRAAARTIGQYSDTTATDSTTTALVTTAREVRIPVRRSERRTMRGSWTKTSEGLRLRWVAGE